MIRLFRAFPLPFSRPVGGVPGRHLRHRDFRPVNVFQVFQVAQNAIAACLLAIHLAEPTLEAERIP
jgi:hypothetical protein